MIDTQPIPFLSFFGDEPIGILFSVVVALLLGGYVRKQYEQSGWAGSIVYSSAYSLIFLGLTLGGYVFLRSNIGTFSSLHQSFVSSGSISWFKWRNVLKTWRGPITQSDLQISHYIETNVLATLPATEPSSPVLYKAIQVRQPVPQNSIVRFQGQVEMLSKKEQGADKFNAYFVNAEYLYDVVNHSEMAVETEFLFPLAPFDGLFENIQVRADGKEVDDLQTNGSGLWWTLGMEPNQKVTISISYVARGLDAYQFVVPQPREIKDFNLSISSDDPNVFVIVNPSGESIHQSTSILPNNVLVLDVSIDRVVVAPVVGISYVQKADPYAPLDLLLRILKFVPRSILFLTTVIALILMISRVSFGLNDMALILAVFWAHGLTFMFSGQFFENPKLILLATSTLATVLVFFLIRHLRTSRLTLFSIICWAVILLGVYPLTGESVNTFPYNQYDNLILIAILIFVFSYLLWIRVHSRIEPS